MGTGDKEKGFSLIEMVAVIAIIGIVYAAIAPNINHILVKSKVKIDIRSVQTFQQQLDLYALDRGNGFVLTDGVVPSSVYTELVDCNYLKKTDVTDEKALKLQTTGGNIWYNSEKEHVQLVLLSDSKEGKIVGELSDTEQEWIR